MALVGALPILSWVDRFTTAHLRSAGDSWIATADLWEGSFTQLARDVLRPGGTEWSGAGADAAQDSADKAAITARGAANQLRDAAAIATFGAEQLDGLHAKTLAAIAEARSSGFQVNEDLSVTDTQRHPWGSNTYAARQAAAEQHAETIHSYAGQLLALDNQYAAKLDTATAGLDSLDRDTPSGHNGIQLVSGHTFKQGPDMSPTPEPGTGASQEGPQPAPRHPEYPDRRTDGTYGEGNSGRDGKWEEKIALDKREQRTGIPIIRELVRATHPNAVNPDGSPQWRYYDGLEPTDVPGEYIGIEAKGDGVPIPGPQKRFDALVTPETPATATLNGEPIKIIDTQIARPELVPQPPPAGPPAPVPQAQPGAPGAPVPGAIVEGEGAAPPTTPFPDWGTHIPPGELAQSDGELGNLGKVIEQYLPPDANDPKNWA